MEERPEKAVRDIGIVARPGRIVEKEAAVPKWPRLRVDKLDALLVGEGGVETAARGTDPGGTRAVPRLNCRADGGEQSTAGRWRRFAIARRTVVVEV